MVEVSGLNINIYVHTDGGDERFGRYVDASGVFVDVVPRVVSDVFTEVARGVAGMGRRIIHAIIYVGVDVQGEYRRPVPPPITDLVSVVSSTATHLSSLTGPMPLSVTVELSVGNLVVAIFIVDLFGQSPMVYVTSLYGAGVCIGDVCYDNSVVAKYIDSKTYMLVSGYKGFSRPSITKLSIPVTIPVKLFEDMARAATSVVEVLDRDVIMRNLVNGIVAAEFSNLVPMRVCRVDDRSVAVRSLERVNESLTVTWHIERILRMLVGARLTKSYSGSYNISGTDLARLVYHLNDDAYYVVEPARNLYADSVEILKHVYEYRTGVGTKLSVVQSTSIVAYARDEAGECVVRVLGAVDSTEYKHESGRSSNDFSIVITSDAGGRVMFNGDGTRYATFEKGQHVDATRVIPQAVRDVVRYARLGNALSWYLVTDPVRS